MLHHFINHYYKNLQSTSTSAVSGDASVIQQRPLPTVPNNNNIQLVSPYNSSPTTVQQQGLPGTPTTPLAMGVQGPSSSNALFFSGNSPSSSGPQQPFPPQQYRYSVHPAATARGGALFSSAANSQLQPKAQLSPPSSADIYSSTHHRLALMPNAMLPRRSSSQDQLQYSGLMGGHNYHHLTSSAIAMQQARARASALYGSPTTSGQMMTFAQNQQRQLPLSLPPQQASPSGGYSTYPHPQHQQQQQAVLGRKQHHLSPMLQQQTSSPLQHLPSTSSQGQGSIYQSPSSAIYGHLMQQQQQHRSAAAAASALQPMAVIQPSMSYQNLHYESTMAAAAAAAAAGEHLAAFGGPGNAHPMYQQHHQHQRPMTSIGFSPSGRLEGGGAPIYQQLTHPPQQQSTSVSPPNALQLPTTSRQFPLSSTSSASLPSTPEHVLGGGVSSSNAPLPNFIYGTTSARTPLSVANYNQGGPQLSLRQSLTPPPPPSHPPPLSPCESTYGTVGGMSATQSLHLTNLQQQQAIYGTIGGGGAGRTSSSALLLQQGPQVQVNSGISATAGIVSAGQSSPLPSNKVRTRYVCIGGNESELSFQPNMVITNGMQSTLLFYIYLF